MMAFLPATFSFPNLSMYQFLPWTALGTMVAISLNKNVLPGIKLEPPMSQKPDHSIHSAM